MTLLRAARAGSFFVCVPKQPTFLHSSQSLIPSIHSSTMEDRPTGVDVRMTAVRKGQYDVEIVQAVQSRKVLYDKSHEHHKNPRVKELEWSRIAAELQVPAVCIIKRWTVIRERFASEKRKVQQLGPSSWWLMNHMEWLDAHIQPRQEDFDTNFEDEMASTSGIKRRHKTLPLQEKWNIIMRVAQGETPTSIARHYEIGRATVHDIVKNKDKIAAFIQSQNAEGERKTLKSSEFPEVEKAVLMWYKQETNKNVPISGELIKQKAQIFYKKMINQDNFRASDGWLENFKRRNSIRLMQPLKSSDDSKFIETLNKKITDSNLDPEQIYCAFGIDLNWWEIPTIKTKPEDIENSKLNLILCSNAAGTNRLKMHVANNDTRLASHQVCGIYTYTNSNISGPEEIFLDWYKGYFEPEVLKELSKQGLPLNALLLVDSNIPGCPLVCKLKYKTDGSIIELVPLAKSLNVDCRTVVKTFTALYRKHVIHDCMGTPAVITAKLFQLKDSTLLASSAWREVKAKTLINFWRNLWPAHPLLPEEPVNDDEMNKAITKALEKCKNAASDPRFKIILPDGGSGAVTVEDLQNWVLDDLNPDLGDDDIVKAVSVCKKPVAKRTKSSEHQSSEKGLRKWALDVFNPDLRDDDIVKPFSECKEPVAKRAKSADKLKTKELSKSHQSSEKGLRKWALDVFNPDLRDDDIVKPVSECKEPVAKLAKSADKLKAKELSKSHQSSKNVPCSSKSRSLTKTKSHQSNIAEPLVNSNTNNGDALNAVNTVLQWLKEKGIVGNIMADMKAIKEFVATELVNDNKPTCSRYTRGKMIESSPNLANLPNLTHISNLAHLSNLANMTKYGTNMINMEDEDSRSHSPILSIAYPEVCMKDVSSDEDAGSYNSLDNTSATNNHSSVSTDGEIRGRRGTHGSEDSSQGGPLALGLDLDEAAAARMLAALKSIEDPIARHRFRSKLHYLSEECEVTALKLHRDLRKEV